MPRALLVLLALLVAACKRAPPPPLPGPAALAIDASAPRKARKGGTDVTFVVASDTHFGFGGIEAINERAIGGMNALVPKPRGLVLTGDLTEWGRVEEWERFLAFYGPAGKIEMPVFEMIGNHDKVHGGWVGERVAERHGGAPYSWNWDDLHLVALGEAPDDAGLDFLARDLDRLERDVPVMVFFHLALEGPWSEGNWFAEGTFKARLAKAIEGRNVVAIVHGHHHQRGHYLWHGVDVYKPCAMKNEARCFAIVHVTDRMFELTWFDYLGAVSIGRHARSLR